MNGYIDGSVRATAEVMRMEPKQREYERHNRIAVLWFCIVFALGAFLDVVLVWSFVGLIRGAL